jgi:hypothetical protein
VRKHLKLVGPFYIGKIVENLQLNLGSYQLALAVSQNDGEHFVALKPLCEALGLEWKRQQKRTLANPQFSVGVHKGGNWSPDGKSYEMLCIPVRQVGMWLCTINANRVNETSRPMLIAFQEQLQVVIHEHLMGRVTIERFQQLEQSIAHLCALVDAQNARIQAQDAEIHQLKQATGQHMTLEASIAGRQLAAAKKTKNLFH